MPKRAGPKRSRNGKPRCRNSARGNAWAGDRRADFGQCCDGGCTRRYVGFEPVRLGCAALYRAAGGAFGGPVDPAGGPCRPRFASPPVPGSGWPDPVDGRALCAARRGGSVGSVGGVWSRRAAQQRPDHHWPAASFNLWAAWHCFSAYFPEFAACHPDDPAWLERHSNRAFSPCGLAWDAAIGLVPASGMADVTRGFARDCGNDLSDLPDQLCHCPDAWRWPEVQHD